MFAPLRSDPGMDAVHDEARSYDAVPYDSNPLRPTHPDHLATQARLWGVPAPDPGRCRLLEIGCATGGNLLPMAVGLPAAHFVGVDISPLQIAAGQRVQRELGVTNLELVAGSITDLSFPPGSFDYVVCHGVWSWVPEVVQQAIFATIGRVLSPHGIAYVSYNTFPGWHQRRMVREMLLHRTRGITAPAERIRAARDYVQFLTRHAVHRDSAYAHYLAEEAQLLAKAADTYVFHEHLEANNRPVWFTEFVAAAGSHGLAYVGEAIAEEALDDDPAIADQLAAFGGGPLERAQHLDCLRNRTFRRSLLCRAGVPTAPTLDPQRLRDCWLGSALQPQPANAELRQPGVVTFVGPGGLRMSVDHPWLKTAFAWLGQRWPECVPFAALCTAVAERLGAPLAAEATAELAGVLLQCHRGGVLELRPRAGSATNTPGLRPIASPLARWMASRGQRVSSLRHELVELRPVDLLLLPLLAGHRDHPALAAALATAATAAGVPLPAGPQAALAESLGLLGVASLLQRPATDSR